MTVAGQVRPAGHVALAGIVAVAFTLRIAIVGIGPLLDPIRGDLGVSRAVAGLLPTIPFVCMSVFAFTGMRVVARLGYGPLVQVCLLVLAVASLLRAVMPTAGLLLLLTVPIGVAVALAGVALPPVIKHGFPRGGGRVTGAYVGAMGLGATLFSATAVPLADLSGGGARRWRRPPSRRQSRSRCGAGRGPAMCRGPTGPGPRARRGGRACCSRSSSACSPSASPGRSPGSRRCSARKGSVMPRRGWRRP